MGVYTVFNTSSMMEFLAKSIIFLLKAAVFVLWMTSFVSGQVCTGATCSITLEEGKTEDLMYPTGSRLQELTWNIETDEELNILVRVQEVFWPASAELSLRDASPLQGDTSSDNDELYSVHDYDAKIIQSDHLLSRGHSIQIIATDIPLPRPLLSFWFQMTAYSVEEIIRCPNSGLCRPRGQWQRDGNSYTIRGNRNTIATLTIDMSGVSEVKGTGFLIFNYSIEYAGTQKEEGRVTIECNSIANFPDTPSSLLTIDCTDISSQITFTARGAVTITLENIVIQDVYDSTIETDEPDSLDVVVPVAIGVVLGVLLMIVTIILVVVLCRARKREKSNRPSRTVAAENGLQNPAFTRDNEYAAKGEYHEYHYPSLPGLQNTNDDPAYHQYDELSRSDMDSTRLDVASNTAHFSSGGDQDYSRIGENQHGEHPPEARPPDTRLVSGANGYETPTLLPESANHQQGTQCSTEANTLSLVDQKLYQHLNRPETPYSESKSASLANGNGTGTDGYGKLNLTNETASHEAPNPPENTATSTALPAIQEDRAKSTPSNSEAEHPKVSALATDSDDYLAVSVKPPPAAVVHGSTDDYEIPIHLSKSGDHPETQDDSSKLPMSNSETEQPSDVAKDNDGYLEVSVKPSPAATAGSGDDYETPTLLSQSSANEQVQPLPDANLAGLADEKLYQHLDRSEKPFSQDSTSGTGQNKTHGDDYGKLELPNKDDTKKEEPDYFDLEKPTG